MKKLAFITSIVALSFGCKKDCDSLLPNCLYKKIEDKEIHGSITRYNSPKGHVYEVLLGDFSHVYNENCDIVCSLGGIKYLNAFNRHFMTASFSAILR